MDILERINRALGTSYERLFGASGDVRPRDILRRILRALDDARREGYDGRTYVPNQVTVEISAADEDERDYLLSFLERSELEGAVQRYCKQNGYLIRGHLDFTIREVPAEEWSAQERYRVRCRYGAPDKNGEPRPGSADAEPRTVAAAVAADDKTNVAARGLVRVIPHRGAPYDVELRSGEILVGRSAQMGNTIVLADDGLVSKRHARLICTGTGCRIEDLESTNGVEVNGKPVSSADLRDGDDIRVGATHLIVTLAARATPPDNRYPSPWMEAPIAPISAAGSRAKLVGPQLPAGGWFAIGSSTSIGRGITNDVVLPHASVDINHATIVAEAGSFFLTPVTTAPTAVNGRSIAQQERVQIGDGDSLTFGSIELHLAVEPS